MKRKKANETVYTIKITEEQIAVIQSLYMRMELLWARNLVAEVLQDNGDVARIPLYECLFCRKGSYENFGSIPHTEDCTCLLANREWDKLNTQFIEVLSERERKP